MAKTQTDETTIADLVLDKIDEFKLGEDDKELINDLIGAFRESEAELTTARQCWREEFDKRKALKKELDNLGKGTSFRDVEKLRKNIHEKELEIYNTREEIRHKTEALENEKSVDRGELREKQDELKVIKKQCEEEYKKEKNKLERALKIKRHNLIIDESEREKADMNKGDWKDHVNKVLTKPDEDAIPKKLKKLYGEQQEKIEKRENRVAEFQKAIDEKHGLADEKIQKLKNSVERKKIGLHNLEMARDNRLKFVGTVEGKQVVVSQNEQSKEKIKVI